MILSTIYQRSQESIKHPSFGDLSLARQFKISLNFLNLIEMPTLDIQSFPVDWIREPREAIEMSPEVRQYILRLLFSIRSGGWADDPEPAEIIIDKCRLDEIDWSAELRVPLEKNVKVMSNLLYTQLNL